VHGTTQRSLMRFPSATLALISLACSSPAPEARSTTANADSSSQDVASAATIRNAAETIASFLYGDAEPDAISLADSVDLFIAPEGGGGHARRSRTELLVRDNWHVRSGNSVYSFVPGGKYAKMTSFVGEHVNCVPAELRAKLPELSARPHVGVLLSNPGQACLASWNATFVFDTSRAKPALIAALYDQWEW
jgi:hypothetical protein